MARRSLLACALLLALMAAPAVASDREPPISFADAESLALTTDSPSTRVQNDTGVRRLVRVSLQITSSDPQGVSFDAETLVLDPADTRRLSLTIVDASKVTAVSGQFVAVDKNSGAVVRQSFILKPPTSAKPPVSSISEFIAIRPWAGEASLTAVPWSQCVAGEPATLGGPSDYAVLTPECKDGELKLTVSRLDDFVAGDYKGTLSLGGTDVAVTYTRSASVWVFFLTVLIGALLSVVMRSYLARAPIGDLRSAARKLQATKLPTPSNWRQTEAVLAFASSARQDSQAVLNDLTVALLWGRRKPILWLLVPSTDAADRLAKNQTKIDAAQAKVAAWTAICPTVVDLSVPGPGNRTDRAEAIKQGTQSAFRNPDGSSRPMELLGVQQFTDEVAALKADANAWTKVQTLAERIGPTPPSATHPSLDPTLLRQWVECRIEVNAIQEAMTRPASTSLSEVLATRVAALELAADRLAGGRRDVGESVESAPVTPVPAFSLPDFVSVAIHRTREFLTRSGRGVAELAFFLLSVVIVALLAASTLYVGKAWGSWWHIAGTIGVAAGGTLVLTPILTMLDRIGGVRPPPPTSK